MRRLSFKKVETGQAIVELLFGVTLLLGIMFWMGHFWEIQQLKLQTREAARYLAWERSAFSEKKNQTQPSKSQKNLIAEIQNSNDGRFFSGYHNMSENGISVTAQIEEKDLEFLEDSTILLSLRPSVPDFNDLMDLRWLYSRFGVKGRLDFALLLKGGNAIGVGLDLYPKGRVESLVRVGVDSTSRLILPLFFSDEESVSLEYEDRYVLEVGDWMSPDLKTMKSIAKDAWAGQPLQVLDLIDHMPSATWLMGDALTSIGKAGIDGRDIPGEIKTYLQ